jgi:hypothetical protein
MKVHVLRWVGLGMAAVVIIAFIIIYIQKSITPTATVEGPHLFYKEGTLHNLTLKMNGGIITEDTVRVQEQLLSDQKFEVNIPNENHSFHFSINENPQIPESKYPVPEKMIVLSDVEGDFDYLKSILIGNKVIDSDYNWVFGKGHLVILGDLFDRGKFVTECLWLIYHLEQEARKYGGHVHFIIGNHEIMTLQGDHRYLAKKYKRFTKKLNVEYKDFFDAHTVLGQWLRTKNSIEIVGDCMVVHGGISMELAQTDLSIDTINQIVRNHMDVSPKFYPDGKVNLIMGSKGPLWFRGFAENVAAEEDVKPVLDRYNVESIVIGHTVMDEITSLYNHRIFIVDAARINGRYSALLIENGVPFKIDNNALKTKL